MRKNKLMYKPQTTVEKICRWTLYILMLSFTGFILHLKYNTYPELTRPEFVKEIWGGYNWMYLVGVIVLFTFLYVKSNWTAFKKISNQ